MSTPEDVQNVLSAEQIAAAKAEQERLRKSDEYLLAPSYDEFQHGLTRNLVIEKALAEGLDPHELALSRLQESTAA